MQKKMFNFFTLVWIVAFVGVCSQAMAANRLYSPKTKEELSFLLKRDIHLGEIDTKSFNQSLDKWNTSAVTGMQMMFKDSPLEKNPPKWYKNNGLSGKINPAKITKVLVRIRTFFESFVWQEKIAR